MNNFSDITAIDIAGKLKVKLIIAKHGPVHYRMRLNGHLIMDTVTEIDLNLLAPIKLHSNIIESNNGHNAVEIVTLSVNGIEILPRYLHLASSPTVWLNQGKWTFAVMEPFYPWYHVISGQGFIA